MVHIKTLYFNGQLASPDLPGKWLLRRVMWFHEKDAFSRQVLHIFDCSVVLVMFLASFGRARLTQQVNRTPTLPQPWSFADILCRHDIELSTNAVVGQTTNDLRQLSSLTTHASDNRVSARVLRVFTL